MPVSSDLRMVIGRLGVAIAGGDTYSRVDLERLRRELNLIACDARGVETRAIEQHAQFGEALSEIETLARDLRNAVTRAQRKREPVNLTVVDAGRESVA
jgi:hypothetical protein